MTEPRTAAEQLRADLDPEYWPDLDEALADERRATVERVPTVTEIKMLPEVRQAFEDYRVGIATKGKVVEVIREAYIRAILDAEAQR